MPPTRSHPVEHIPLQSLDHSNRNGNGNGSAKRFHPDSTMSGRESVEQYADDFLEEHQEYLKGTAGELEPSHSIRNSQI